MSATEIRVYLAYGINGASVDFIRFVNEFGEALEYEYEVEILRYDGPLPRNLRNIEEHAARSIENCDCMIAFIDHSTSGLQAELQKVIFLGKPLLCMYHVNAQAPLRLPSEEMENVTVERYQTIGDAILIAAVFLSEHPEAPPREQ